MSETRSFDGVTAEILDRIKAYGRDAHGTVFEPPAGPCGTATTRTPIGDVVVSYDLDEVNERITYAIERKPFFVMSWQIWDGIAASLEKCRSCS